LKVFHGFFQDMQRPGAYTNGGDVAMFRHAAEVVAFAVVACSCRDGQTIRSSTFSPSPTRPVSPRLEVAAGGTLTATIWGDSALLGEDWTGANCDAEIKPCELVHVTTSRPGTLTVRMTWNGADNQLGVFISTGWFDGRGAYGRSPLEAAQTVSAGETLVVVSFERAGAARPALHASQSFELSTFFEAR
jgi:hypothetical protein